MPPWSAQAHQGPGSVLGLVNAKTVSRFSVGIWQPAKIQSSTLWQV